MKKIIYRITTTILLGCMFIALIPAASFIAIEAVNYGYNQYFSQERVLTFTPVESTSDIWKREPIFVADYNLDFMEAQYGNVLELISTGDLYHFRKIDDRYQLVKISSGNSAYANYGSVVYLAKNGILTTLNLDTLETENLISVDNTITEIAAYDDLLFFRAGNKLYRYYIPSSKLDFIVEVENLVAWRAFSNQVINYSVPNPIYSAAVAASGVREDQIPENPSQYAEWLNTHLKLGIDESSTLLTQCDVMNILHSVGVEELVHNWFDIESKSTVSQYSPPLTETENILSAGSTSASSETQTTSSDLNIPNFYSGLSSSWIYYQTNEYFNDFRTSPCTCHAYCNWNTGCDCRLYDGAIQCMGYAKYMFTQISGARISQLNNEYRGTFPSLPASSNTLYSFFQSFNFPFVLGVTTSKQGEHYILVYDVDPDYVWICEANTVRIPNSSAIVNTSLKYCRVSNYQKITYAEFCSRYINILSLEDANPCSHTTEWFMDEEYHWGECSKCGKITSEKEEHWYYWESNSSKHWEMCDFCQEQVSTPQSHSNVWHSNATQHWCTCSVCLATTYPAEDHWTYTEYDEDSHWSKCDMCLEDLSVQEPHTITWNYNDNYHWATCSDCNYTTPRTQHTWSNDSDACTTCGYD